VPEGLSFRTHASHQGEALDLLALFGDRSGSSNGVQAPSLFFWQLPLFSFSYSYSYSFSYSYSYSSPSFRLFTLNFEVYVEGLKSKVEGHRDLEVVP
jgi:hypothetical protein